MECVIYRQDGTAHPLTGEATAIAERAARLSPGEFVWIQLADDEHEALLAVSGPLGLHPLPSRVASGTTPRPHREHAGDQLYLTVRVIRGRGTDLHPVALRLLAGPAFVVTVTGDAAVIADTHRRLADHPSLPRLGPPAVAYAMAAAVIDDYDRISEDLRGELRRLEERVFAPGRDDLSQDIYLLKRAVLEVGDAVGPLVPIVEDLLSGGGVPTGQIRHHLRDLAHRLRRVDASVNGFDDLLNSVSAAHLARVSTRQNDDMRRISAWAAVAAAPTVIASVYGMNFADMPELRWAYGYPAVWLLMIVTSLVIYLAFRRNKWL